MSTDDGPRQIHLTIPPRLYVGPGAALLAGSCIGIVRGSRRASLRFLAENAHRPPTTVRGWYLYNKTKNYKVLLGGLKAAGADGSRLAVTAFGWVSIAEGLERAGWGEFGEVGAGVGTAGVFSAVYRLPWKATSRTLALGLVVGSTVSLLRWGQGQLRALQKETSEEAVGGEEENKATESVDRKIDRKIG